MNTIIIKTIDDVTVNGAPCGSITNVIANKNATPQEAHDALAAFITSKDQALVNTKTLQGQIDSLMLAFNAAKTPEEQAPIIAQANALTTAGQLAILQKKEAEHQANLTATQAQIAALTPSNV